MRSSSPVLLLTQDERLVQAARLEIYAQSPLDLIVARTFEEGFDLLSNAQPCAVVVHLEAGLADEHVSQLLWAASVAPRPAPVLALTDQYDEGRGRTLFELGVTDYLSRCEHLSRLATLLRRVVRCPQAVDETGWDVALRANLTSSSRITETSPVPSVPHLPGLHRFPILGEG